MYCLFCMIYPHSLFTEREIVHHRFKDSVDALGPFNCKQSTLHPHLGKDVELGKLKLLCYWSAVIGCFLEWLIYPRITQKLEDWMELSYAVLMSAPSSLSLTVLYCKYCICVKPYEVQLHEHVNSYGLKQTKW